jgi:hypothetical protein
MNESASSDGGSLMMKNSGGRTCLISAAAKGLRQKNDDGKLLLRYSPRLEPFVFHRLHSPRHGRRLHPRDEAFGDIVTELFFRQVAACPDGRWHNWGGDAT